MKNEKTKAKKASRILKGIENTLFTLFMIVMVGLILITAQSRFTGKEPSLLGHKLYIVNSGSMSPTIWEHSMIIVKELEPQEVMVQDIITYYGATDSDRVTHRVMEVENKGESFITRGDANETDDPMPLDGEKLIGKVVFTIPLIGLVFRFLSTIQGIGLLVVLAAIWIVVPKLLSKRSHSSKEPHGPTISME